MLIVSPLEASSLNQCTGGRQWQRQEADICGVGVWNRSLGHTDNYFFVGRVRKDLKIHRVFLIQRLSCPTFRVLVSGGRGVQISVQLKHTIFRDEPNIPLLGLHHNSRTEKKF